MEKSKFLQQKGNYKPILGILLALAFLILANCTFNIELPPETWEEYVKNTPSSSSATPSSSSVASSSSSDVVSQSSSSSITLSSSATTPSSSSVASSSSSDVVSQPSSSSITLSSSSVALFSSSSLEGANIVLCLLESGICRDMEHSTCLLLAGIVVNSCPATPPSSSSSVRSSSSAGGVFYDSRDSKEYVYVAIGTQVWMAENLNYEVSGSVCYNNLTSNCTTYGRLYDWATAMTVCPSGWHLPSNAEWDKLMRYVDGTSGTSSPYSSSTAGRYLKAASGWNSYSGIVNSDIYGFSALPGGYDDPGGNFDLAGNDGVWWSASVGSNNYAYSRHMYYNGEYAYWSSYNKSYLFSVRCVQD